MRTVFAINSSGGGGGGSSALGRSSSATLSVGSHHTIASPLSATALLIASPFDMQQPTRHQHQHRGGEIGTPLAGGSGSPLSVASGLFDNVLPMPPLAHHQQHSSTAMRLHHHDKSPLNLYDMPAMAAHVNNGQTAPQSTLHHPPQQHQPRSCHKKLGFDDAARPSTAVLAQHQAAKESMVHAAAVAAAQQQDAELQLLSPSSQHGASAFARAAFLYTNGTNSAMGVAPQANVHAHTRPHSNGGVSVSGHASPQPFRDSEEGGSPSPFMPAASPSPSMSSMALSLAQSPASVAAQHSHSQSQRLSQSPLFTPPALFSPDTNSLLNSGVSPAPHTHSLDHKPSSGNKVPQFTANLATDTRLSQPLPLPPKEKRAAAVAAANANAAAAAAAAQPPSTPPSKGHVHGERHSSRISAAEAKAAALAALAPSPVNSPPAAASCKGCNCKKSRCLKLYCECFARQGFCSSECKCTLCQNVPGDTHAEERAKAIAATLERDPRAFFRSAEAAQAGATVKGCNCRKSGCQKKYCECYQTGVQCTEACKCVDCKNGRPHSHSDRDEGGSPTITKSAKRKTATSGSSQSTAATSASKRAPKRPPPASLTRAEAAAQADAEYERAPSASKRGQSTLAAPTIQASRTSQRERSNSLRARESQLAEAEERALLSRVSPLDPSALSPATTNSSTSTASSGVNHQISTAMGVRTLAPRHTLVLGGVGSMSFQAQLAAHQAQQASEKSAHAHAMEDSLETDSDFTSCADSLHEIPAGLVSALNTPVKPTRHPSGKTSSRPNGGANFSALTTLVEVASPSPRMQHYPNASGLLSPVSPMSASLQSIMPSMQTPNSKPRHRALIFNGGGASPLPPLFSPLRHTQAPSPQLHQGSPFPGHNLSISPAPMGMHHLVSGSTAMGTVLAQQHQSMAHAAASHSQHAHAYYRHHGGSSNGGISPFLSLAPSSSLAASHLAAGADHHRTQRDLYVFTPPLPTTAASLTHATSDGPNMTHAASTHTLVVS